jgi:hypothetical protein
MSSFPAGRHGEGEEEEGEWFEGVARTFAHTRPVTPSDDETMEDVLSDEQEKEEEARAAARAEEARRLRRRARELRVEWTGPLQAAVVAHARTNAMNMSAYSSLATCPLSTLSAQVKGMRHPTMASSSWGWGEGALEPEWGEVEGTWDWGDAPARVTASQLARWSVQHEDELEGVCVSSSTTPSTRVGHAMWREGLMGVGGEVLSASLPQAVTGIPETWAGDMVTWLHAYERVTRIRHWILVECPAASSSSSSSSSSETSESDAVVLHTLTAPMHDVDWTPRGWCVWYVDMQNHWRVWMPPDGGHGAVRVTRATMPGLVRVWMGWVRGGRGAWYDLHACQDA